MRLTSLLVSLLLGAPALAQEPVTSAPVDTAVDLAQEAELHFRLGIDAYREGDYTRALEHMLLSNRLAPNKNVLFNIGQCYVGLEQYDNAWRAFDAYRARETDPGRQVFAQRELDKLADRVALLEITSDPPGATIYLDRKDLGARGHTPTVLAVPPGEHRVILETQGFRPGEVTASAVLGKSTPTTTRLEALVAQVSLLGTHDAQVTVEDTGQVLGALPLETTLPPRPAVLLVSRDGFEDERVLVNPTLVEPLTVTVELTARTAPVEFTSLRRGARVEVDGELVGYTPLLADLPLGEHEVVISEPGYLADTRLLDVGDEGAAVDVALLRTSEVVTGSGVREDLVDAPASIVVITADQIAQRGYDDLAELVRDLPGFDSTVLNGTAYQNSYQRGYRTEFTQRTLFLVDGRVDNHLWTQAASLSRQYPITMIDRVEVLYGPASAVYGTNAFLGIINVVTKKGSSLPDDGATVDARIGYGSFRTKVVDGTVLARSGELSFNASARVFVSDEDDLTGDWGFVDQGDLTDENIWGGLLDQQSLGHTYGDGYADPTRDWGAQANVQIRGLELGTLMWDRTEGYGPYYASDAAHSAATWSLSSRQVYARHKGELRPNLTVATDAGWRDSRVAGDWAESYYDGSGRSVSLTRWHSYSQAWNAGSTATWQARDNLSLTGGVRYEHQLLTKSYEIPGYGYTSQSIGDQQVFFDPANDDPADFQPGPSPAARMGRENLQPIDDLGGFVQGIWDHGPVRINAGAALNRNSFYHRNFRNPSWEKPLIAFNPRASFIYKLGDTGAIKLLYGEAFQVPAALLVWGGWNGRASNEGLIPEKARNLEVVGMLRTTRLTAEASGFAGFYRNVILEATENHGERTTAGIELRTQASLPNPVPDSEDVQAFANYTFTVSRSSLSWDPNAEAWVELNSRVGDIAPHKVNMGVTLPIGRFLSVHTRANVVSSRTPYGRNALRADGYRFPAYVNWNAYVEGGPEDVRFGLRFWNLLDSAYLMPGGEAASAGGDFTEPSRGFQNSAVPAAGRSVLGTVRIRL